MISRLYILAAAPFEAARRLENQAGRPSGATPARPRFSGAGSGRVSVPSAPTAAPTGPVTELLSVTLAPGARLMLDQWLLAP